MIRSNHWHGVYKARAYTVWSCSTHHTSAAKFSWRDNSAVVREKIEYSQGTIFKYQQQFASSAATWVLHLRNSHLWPGIIRFQGWCILLHKQILLLPWFWNILHSAATRSDFNMITLDMHFKIIEIAYYMSELITLDSYIKHKYDSWLW